MFPLKRSLLIALLCLSGCSWFHSRTPPESPPTQLLVNGAPSGSVLVVDGMQAGPATDGTNRAQQVDVAPGAHVLEVKTGDSVVYRENTYVEAGQTRVVTVLSGSSPPSH
jgi:hypothetical protein